MKHRHDARYSISNEWGASGEGYRRGGYHGGGGTAWWTPPASDETAPEPVLHLTVPEKQPGPLQMMNQFLQHLHDQQQHAMDERREAREDRREETARREADRREDRRQRSRENAQLIRAFIESRGGSQTQKY